MPRAYLSVQPSSTARLTPLTPLEAVAAIARERGCFRLEVTTQPEREAVHFYRAHGFEELPRRLLRDLGD